MTTHSSESTSPVTSTSIFSVGKSTCLFSLKVAVSVNAAPSSKLLLAMRRSHVNLTFAHLLYDSPASTRAVSTSLTGKEGTPDNSLLPSFSLVGPPRVKE